MTGMRVLTVRQPWAWAIMHGGKDVENRSRNIAGDYRGPVAILAARSIEATAFSNSFARQQLNAAANRWYEDFDPHGQLVEPWNAVRGAIIGVVDLVDVHRVLVTDYRYHCETVPPPPLKSNAIGACSSWAELEAHHLVFENPRPLLEPIELRGALGLQHLDEDIIAQILAQIGA